MTTNQQEAVRAALVNEEWRKLRVSTMIMATTARMVLGNDKSDMNAICKIIDNHFTAMAAEVTRELEKNDG